MFQKKPENPTIYVKYPDLVVPEMHFKFFILTYGPDCPMTSGLQPLASVPCLDKP